MAIRLPIVSSFDNKGIRRARTALQSFGNFAADIGKIAAGAVTAVAVAGVREAAQFESSIAKIEGLVGVGGEQLDQLAAKARELGPEFGKSANEAADALFFITSAGLRGEGAIEVLEASLKGAAIGLGETKTIADLATSAVNAYGESQLGGAKAVDVLTEAVRLGKLEPAELAQSMGQVLPLASNLGVRFDEVGAAMAGMSKTGTDASTASTQLRQILTTIAKPTSEANEALADMGLSAEGLREQIREEGLFSTLETLTEAFDGNIEATSSVFGNVRALSGVLDLMGASAEDNREVFNQLADDTGVLDEAFAVTADTAEFKFDKSMGRVKESLLGIGEDLLERLLPHLDNFNSFMEENGPQIEEAFSKIFDVVEDVAIEVGNFVSELQEDPEFQEFLANLLDNFEELWPEVKEAVKQLADLAVELGPLAGDLGLDAIEFVTDLTSIMSNLAFFTNEAVDAFEDLGVELPNLAGPLGMTIDPIGTLARNAEALADGLNRVRDAYERFQAFGFDITPDFFEDSPFTFRLVGPGGPSGFLPSNDRRIPDHLNLSGARAMGGLVTGGQMYSVGERGPEMFVPAENGSIIPNDQLGGNTYNVTVNAGVGTDGPQVAEQIVRLIRRYERNSGPVFQRA